MFRYCSIILWFAVAALVALGLVMLASISTWVKDVETPYYYLQRQSVMAGVGLVAALIATFVEPSWLRKYWPWMLLAICVLLALCFVPGIGKEVLGSKRWIRVPGIGQFQPSELARPVCMIALAGWFARWQSETKTFFRGFFCPGILLAAPLLLIAAETDVGSALSISVAIAAVMFCMGTRPLYLLPTATIAISGAAWFVRNNENRWSRIQAWLDLEGNALGKGMQQWRALLAFGNGGPSGVGLGNSSEKLGLMAFPHADFIFPVIGEELGLYATLGVVLCYVLIAVCGAAIAIQASTVFEKGLAIGLTTMLVVPAMVNIAVTTAVFPNDGLPLPFVSFGGSSIIFSLATVGLLIGIHRRAIPRETTADLRAGRQQKSFAIKL